MAVGEPEKDNSPVGCYPGERPSQEGLGRPAKRRRDSEAQGRSAGAKRWRQGAREKIRGGVVLHYVEHIFRAQRRRRGQIRGRTTTWMWEVESCRE